MIILDVIIIIILFLVYGYIHSLLASLKVKKILTEKLGDKIAFYRLSYNIFALLLFLWFYSLMPKPSLLIYDLPNPFDLIVLIPQLAGLAGFIWTFKYISFGEFAGFNQIIRWKNNEYDINETDERLTLRIEGPYKYTRHPLYFFAIVFLLFRPAMDLFYFILLVCIITYFYIGSVYEEKKLVEQFGDTYRDYQQKVPRIIPF